MKEFTFNLNGSINISTALTFYQVCTNIVSKQMFLVKKMPKTEALPFEVLYQSQLNHPNIISTHQVYYDEFNWYTLLKYPGSSYVQLSKLITTVDFTEANIEYMLNQILNVLCYLKTLNLQVRNMSTETILVDAHFNLLFIDFAQCMAFDEYSESQLNTHVLFCAPEQLAGRSSHEVDVWAFGIIAYLLWYKDSPYSVSRNDPQLLEMMVKDGMLTKRLNRNKRLDIVNELLLDGMLKVNLGKRVTLSKLQEHYMFRVQSDRSKKLYLASHPLIQTLADFNCNALIPNLIAVKCNFYQHEDYIKAFQTIDSDHNGFIDRAELEEILTCLYNDQSDSRRKTRDIMNLLQKDEYLNFFDFCVCAYKFKYDALIHIVKTFWYIDIDMNGDINLRDFFKKLKIEDQAFIEGVILKIQDLITLKDRQRVNIVDFVDLLMMDHSESYTKSEWYVRIKTFVNSNHANWTPEYVEQQLIELLNLLDVASANEEEFDLCQQIDYNVQKTKKFKCKVEKLKKKIKKRDSILKYSEKVLNGSYKYIGKTNSKGRDYVSSTPVVKTKRILNNIKTTTLKKLDKIFEKKQSNDFNLQDPHSISKNSSYHEYNQDVLDYCQGKSIAIINPDHSDARTNHLNYILGNRDAYLVNTEDTTQNSATHMYKLNSINKTYDINPYFEHITKDKNEAKSPQLNREHNYLNSNGRVQENIGNSNRASYYEHKNFSNSDDMIDYYLNYKVNDISVDGNVVQVGDTGRGSYQARSEASNVDLGLDLERDLAYNTCTEDRVLEQRQQQFMHNRLKSIDF